MGRWALLALIAAVVALLMLPATAMAADIRSGDSVTIDSGEFVEDDLYAFAAVVEVAGSVDGDVIAAGQRIVVTGDVRGDVFAAGATVQVDGNVEGNVRATGGSVDVAGVVAKDVLIAGGTVAIAGDTQISRDVAVGGGIVRLGGDVARDVDASAGQLYITGDVGGDVTADAGDLVVTDTATIQGDLSYSVTQSSTLDGTVGGRTERREPPQAPREPVPDEDGAAFAGLGFAVLWWLRTLVGVLLLGALLMWLFPCPAEHAARHVKEDPWISLGLGLLIIFGVPFLAAWVFFLGLFIGGWWISFVVLAAWWLLMVAGFVYGTYAIARLLPPLQGLHPIWTALIALAVIWVVGAIPFVGWLAVAAAVVMGTGALAKSAWEHRLPCAPVPEQPAVPQTYGYEASPTYPEAPPAYPGQPPTYPPPTYAPPEYPAQPPVYAPPAPPQAEAWQTPSESSAPAEPYPWPAEGQQYTPPEEAWSGQAPDLGEASDAGEGGGADSGDAPEA